MPSKQLIKTFDFSNSLVIENCSRNINLEKPISANAKIIWIEVRWIEISLLGYVENVISIRKN